jgi:hypothetical protein
MAVMTVKLLLEIILLLSVIVVVLAIAVIILMYDSAVDEFCISDGIMISDGETLIMLVIPLPPGTLTMIAMTNMILMAADDVI